MVGDLFHVEQILDSRDQNQESRGGEPLRKGAKKPASRVWLAGLGVGLIGPMGLMWDLR